MALLALVFAFVFGFIGSVMATNRQNSAVGGFCWGFFLGVIGLVIIAVTPPPVPEPPVPVAPVVFAPKAWWKGEAAS